MLTYVLNQINYCVFRHIERLSEVLLLPNVLNRIIVEQVDISLGRHHYRNACLKKNVLYVRFQDCHSLRLSHTVLHELYAEVKTFASDKVCFASKHQV